MNIPDKEIIHIGQKPIQRGGRIQFLNLLDANGLKEGDVVDVYLRKVKP